MKPDQLNPALVPALLQWYRKTARDLPWRRDREPYHVWLSEIMLQQTRVEAVIPYYTRFLQAVPSLEALANLPEDALLKLWEGLGYYNRARNLKRAAQMVVQQYGGSFPQSYEALRALPGVGDYTAGAIASICFGQTTPAVDGNVLRVAARLTEYGGAGEHAKKEVRTALLPIYPQQASGEFTQALMELGATICLPTLPRCKGCPISAFCSAHREGTTGSYPAKEKKTARVTEKLTVLVLLRDNTIALDKRPSNGLLAGLWALPNVEGHLSADEAFALADSWALSPQDLRRASKRRHIFTHRVWDIQVYEIVCGTAALPFVWAQPAELESRYALPTAFRICLQ